MKFAMGVVSGGLALSACWGWLWLIIATVGFARGVSSVRVVMHSLVAGISPLLLGWALWWMAPDAFAPHTAFILGLVLMPLTLMALALRKASDGRPAGLHMVGAMRHFTDELLGAHQGCEGCDHDHGADAAGRQT